MPGNLLHGSESEDIKGTEPATQAACKDRLSNQDHQLQASSPPAWSDTSATTTTSLQGPALSTRLLTDTQGGRHPPQMVVCNNIIIV